MCLSQLPKLLIFICFCFPLGHQIFASVPTQIDVNQCHCRDSEYNLAVASLLSPPHVYTSSIPKLQKAVPAFSRTNTFANYVIVVITILNIIVYKLKQSNEADSREKNIQSSPSFGKHWRLFSIREIKLATHNFDEDLLLGRGGFGKVYKGLLNIDGVMSTVAVKRLNSKSRQRAKEFYTEIEMVSNFRHSHLVSLIGYCNEENEMIFVYEYMPHGTLSDHLYKNSRNGPVGSQQPLNWEQRLKICIGAARGLDYLHTGTGLQQRVIHRDVKSSNILLDEHWEAKVSDFGLSKIGPANRSCSHVSTNIKGTRGYMDPEYLLTHRLTRKSDVYSFGVVLFEVLCGRRALDTRIDEDQQALARYAHRCIQEGTIDQIIDSTLRGQISKDCLKVFVDIGDQCLHYQQRKRPTMADVVAKLEFAMELQKRTESSADYMFPLDSRRGFGNQENNDTVGILENVEDLVLCNQGDDAGGIVENQRNLPSLKKKDKGMLKLVARKIFKAILVVGRGKKNLARQNTNYGSSLRPTNLEPSIIGSPLSIDSSPSLVCSLSEETQIPQFSFLKIQAATNSFHAGLVLTCGHQGMVFKGHLDSEDVVIKQVILTSQRRGYESFRNEILRAKINHLHVLPWIGFCCDCDDVYRLYLVSKYMFNGSLDYHLHNNNNTHLTWNLRLQICIGVAKGLNYLHTGIASHIITHGKIKANKILLDENWIPKVSGYGLWQLGTSIINSDNYLRSQELVAPFDFWETWAYLSPEQKAQERLTPKADVYSLGIVLLNVLFDWRHIIMTLARLNDAQVSLSAWVKSNIREKSLMFFMYPYLAGKVASECFVEILDIALHCLMEGKDDRPSMEDVVKRLEFALELQINHTWNFLDDEINQLECALQIQLQTNHSWRLDVDGNDHITTSSRSLNDTDDDGRMNSWNTQMSIPNFDFDSMEFVR